MKLRIIFVLVFAVYSASFVRAQTSPMTDLERETAAIEASNAALRAELMKLRAEIVAFQAAQAGDLKRFVIPWDCSQYLKDSSAREMCEKAHEQHAVNPITGLKTTTGAHEGSHYINSMCRNMPANQRRRGTCIHVGWKDGNPEVVWVDEPANTSIKGLDQSGCLPGFFKTCSKYQTYIIDSQKPPPPSPDGTPMEIQTQLTYLFDEWGAYVMGARTNIHNEIKLVGKTIIRRDLDDVMSGPVAFSIIGASIAQYVQRNDPARFNSPEFRLFIKLQIENSMNVIREALMAQAQMGAYRDIKGNLQQLAEPRRLLEQFSRTEQAKLLRAMYGDAWFDRTFDIGS